MRNSQLVAAKVSKLEFRGKKGKFPRHFNGLFQLGMCEFDPSQVSQTVAQPEIAGTLCAKSPHLWGFCVFAARLQSPENGNFSENLPIVSGQIRRNSRFEETLGRRQFRSH